MAGSTLSVDTGPLADRGWAVANTSVGGTASPHTGIIDVVADTGIFALWIVSGQ